MPVDPTFDGLIALQVLLRADKGVEKFSDRTILKNLGHWLGLMTIAKSKPILQASLMGFMVSPMILLPTHVLNLIYLCSETQF